MKNWKAAAVLTLAIMLATGLARADYSYRDGGGTLRTFFAFVCQSTKVCPAQVLIDSTGNEKATTANPLYVISPDSTVTGTITSDQSVSIPTAGLSTVAFITTGTWTGTLATEGTIDGVNWFATSTVSMLGGTIFGGAVVSNDAWQVNVAGFSAFRVRGDTIASGAAAVSMRASVAVANVMADNPFQIIPTIGTGAFQPITLSTSPSTVFPAGSATRYISLHNLCGVPGGCSAYVICRFGGTPANPPTGGEITLSPGQAFSEENSYVEQAALSCLATAPGTPFTYAVK